MTATNARLRGVFILICGLPLVEFGLWLMWIVLARPMPDWLPKAILDVITPAPGLRIEGLDASSTDEQRLRSLPGVASVLVLAFGAVAALQGAIMLLFGRRSVALLVLMLAVAAAMVWFGGSVIKG